MSTIRSRASLLLGVVLLMAGVGLAASTGATSFAASSSGSTTANVAVAPSITLSGLTPSFTLSGDPNTTVTSPAAASMKVTTNNTTGYNVTVQAAASSLAAVTTGNTDSIPIGNLKVKGPANPSYTALSNTSAVTVKTSSTKSASTGDTISNDYQVDIPFVNSDTYRVTLNYVASTL